MTHSNSKKLRAGTALIAVFALATMSTFVAGYEAAAFGFAIPPTTEEDIDTVVGNEVAVMACPAGPLSYDESLSGNIQTSEIGQVMPDGTIFAGISPNTGEALYAMPQDTPLKVVWGKPKEMRWHETARYAANLKAHGHKDWRLPTVAELMVLYENRHKGALKDTFNRSSTAMYAYWSCTGEPPNRKFAQVVTFTNGEIISGYKTLIEFPSRLVRTEPRP